MDLVLFIVTLSQVIPKVTNKENIMLGKPNDINSLKLIDFGLSAKYSEKETIALTEQCGTAIYMAPEIFNNYQYTKVRSICNY